jgi:hypothetical protein
MAEESTLNPISEMKSNGGSKQIPVEEAEISISDAGTNTDSKADEARTPRTSFVAQLGTKVPAKKMWLSKQKKEPGILTSTNLVFFKIADYIDFEGNYTISRGNFLFVFKSVETFFDFALACIIQISQLVILLKVYDETKKDCTEASSGVIWMGGNYKKYITYIQALHSCSFMCPIVTYLPIYLLSCPHTAILCSLYAACVSVEAFLMGMPYEVYGTTPAAAKDLMQRVEQSKRSNSDCLSDAGRASNLGSDPVMRAAVENALNPDIEPEEEPEEEQQGGKDKNEEDPDMLHMIKNVTAELEKYFDIDLNFEIPEQVDAKVVMHTVSKCYLFFVALGLQLSNALLLLVVAYVMGTAASYTDLISKFISVEIVIHIHELVPRVLRMQDHSPNLYNKSGNNL